MGTEEFFKMMLNERICSVIQEKYKQDDERRNAYQKAVEQWEQVLKKQGKEVEQEFDQYFSAKEAWEAEEQEALYLAGFSDAIQLIKRMGLIG